MKRPIKVSLIVAGCLIPIICVAWFYRHNLQCYYFLYKMNNFSKGDKLYTWDWMVKTRSSAGPHEITLYRYAVPLNNEKGDKPIILESEWYISADSLFKYKTSWIGNYTGWVVENIKLGDTGFPFPYYSITTNKKALVKLEELLRSGKLPPGYTWGDGPFYIAAIDVNPKSNEITDFPKMQIVEDPDKKNPAAK